MESYANNHEQNWQLYPVDPYSSAVCDYHIHTYKLWQTACTANRIPPPHVGSVVSFLQSSRMTNEPDISADICFLRNLVWSNSMVLYRLTFVTVAVCLPRGLAESRAWGNALEIRRQPDFCDLKIW